MSNKDSKYTNMNSPKIKHALISVSDKLGLVDFARGLTSAGIEIFSTGGTRRHLEEAGIAVRDVSDYTGFPEMMDGRLKTLHPKVAGGVLCRHDHDADMAAIAEHGIVPFELVVINLYPFEATVAREGVTVEEAIEQIDIGGPTLVRAAAKNHAFVTIATDREQYVTILEQVNTDGATTPEFRRQCAGEAFTRTAAYDQAISAYFAKLASDELHPELLHVGLRRKAILRYGENPHQTAALYAVPGSESANLVSARQLSGKELSYNNLLDLDSALALVRSLPGHAAVVLKHNNPCGAAVANSLVEATQRAWSGDPLSAFGSVLGFNQSVDAATAEFLAEPGKFVEAIVAPDFDAEALEILTTKPKWKANVRLIAVGSLQSDAAGRQLRNIDGGFLVQDTDIGADPETEWRVATEKQPDDRQLSELRFAWAVCRHVKSNAIVLGADRSLVGVGAGQMSRVDSVEIAINKAGDRSRGAVMASDAFFPFDDSIHRAAEAGIEAIIQPGGSRGDDAVIAACNERGLAMVLTGRRHFKH
jgi:phosphoribosylaminoimidazolecarboxamide formyltransferase/IMP cyclohydrolase